MYPCMYYLQRRPLARIAIITVVQHGISSDGSNFGPIGRRADNCCAEPGGGTTGDASRNCGIQYTACVLFFAFSRVVARAQECSADIQRLFSSGMRKSEDGKAWGWVAGATNGLKPAVPEARRARRVIRLARVPTTLSRV